LIIKGCLEVTRETLYCLKLSWKYLNRLFSYWVANKKPANTYFTLAWKIEMSYTHLLYHCNMINKIYRSLHFISLFAFLRAHVWAAESSVSCQRVREDYTKVWREMSCKRGNNDKNEIFMFGVLMIWAAAKNRKPLSSCEIINSFRVRMGKKISKHFPMFYDYSPTLNFIDNQSPQILINFHWVMWIWKQFPHH
jgi:hypothetical protein